MKSVTYGESPLGPASRCWRRVDQDHVLTSSAVRCAPRFPARAGSGRRRAPAGGAPAPRPARPRPPGAPVTVSRIISDASGRPTSPRERQPPLGQRRVARRPACGSRRPGPRAARARRPSSPRRPRSASARHNFTTRASSARASSASAPCPIAGSMRVGVEPLGDARREAQAIEPGRRQHRRVDDALGDLAQARVDVAAQDLDATDRRAPRGPGRRAAGSTCRRGCPAAAPPARRRRG